MKEVYKAYMMDQLKNLISIDSPTGFTNSVQDYLCKEISRIGYTPERLHKGGVRAELGGKGNGIMLFSHCDTLGAVVSTIKKNGRLTLSRVGGLNPNNVETEQVKVHTRFNGSYEGTIQVPNASVHVNANVNKPRSFEENLEIVLDEFVSSDTEVREIGIRNGDFVTLNPRFTVTSKGFIKSRFLDDKASAAVLLTYAKYLKDEGITPSRRVVIGFTVYEEVGHGAACGIPDGICDVLAVDMGCVGDGLDCTEAMVSICAKDSGGPYNYDMTTDLVNAAKSNDIDYAVDIYNSYGSDVEVSLKSGYNVRHALIGPGVYASHGYERTHINGLINTFNLIKTYIG
ncbi:MAG: M42 family metallopeptidase [Clostridiaceae bacterium]|nr:M42 family metallopeptidase [Clostridiaceae bacterium]